MVNTLQAFNCKELGEYNDSRTILINLVNKLNTEKGNKSGHVVPDDQMKEKFTNDPDYGIEGIKFHFREDQSSKVEEFQLYFTELKADVVKMISKVENDPVFVEMKQKWERNPEDLQVSYDLACKAAELLKYELAIQLLLSIVETDKNWQNNQAVEKIKSLFNEIGNSSSIVLKARKELNFLLY